MVKIRAKTQQGKIRIIGGTWRGRMLPVADLPGLRPTGARHRETLFNWLQPQLPGARCLDLFSGSGALGFEALSRSAANVSFLDNNRANCQQLEANKTLLNANAEIICANSLQWLKTQTPSAFDIAFVDPPFADGLLDESLQLLNLGWLSQQALIYIETGIDTPYQLPSDWKVLREKTAGQVQFYLAQASG